MAKNCPQREEADYAYPNLSQTEIDSVWISVMEKEGEAAQMLGQSLLSVRAVVAKGGTSTFSDLKAAFGVIVAGKERSVPIAKQGDLFTVDCYDKDAGFAIPEDPMRDTTT